MLVAGNTRNYAGLVEITREAQADDGLLDVCVYEGKGTMDIVLHALRTVLRRHLRSKKVTYRKVRRLEFARGEAAPGGGGGGAGGGAAGGGSLPGGVTGGEEGRGLAGGGLEEASLGQPEGEGDGSL